ncbi:mechanosensitive ion channel [Herbivorax sp. ANBcel31]|uniref:mechanosensitive ion channel n=1 Tax=Herbivorax sp. ANBcel31 TaxID=3069754 RepID=UPI0027B7ED24|nr:mechanosensitive ion channel [Herbivorax sp. ANBcel31]MDQ2085581.1 mechanosensitive ion channel [Herbivorax sp. ANBcel31]
MDYLQELLNSFEDLLPSVVTAILLLIVAYLVAVIAKKIVMKGLKLLKLERYTDKLGIVDEVTGSSLEFIGKLVFVIVFLMFLPAVLDNLNMQNVSNTITGLVSQFVDFIPNILAAILILVFGAFIAKIIRQIITPMLKRLNIDKLQEKAGVGDKDSVTFSTMISYVVYVIILIPVIIAALQVLNITAISEPATSVLDTIFTIIPQVIIALALIIIGTYVAKITGKLLSNLLSSVGADAVTKRITSADNSKLNDFSLSKTVGEVVRYIIVLLFVVQAINIINLDVLQSVGEAIIAYLPFVISAIIIMGVAIFFAAWVEGFMKKKYPDANLTTLIVKYAIIVVAIFMTLIQLDIATSIVNAAFIIVLGALAIAFAISFGIGGREFAAKTMEKLSQNEKGPGKR